VTTRAIGSEAARCALIGLEAGPPAAEGPPGCIPSVVPSLPLPARHAAEASGRRPGESVTTTLGVASPGTPTAAAAAAAAAAGRGGVAGGLGSVGRSTSITVKREAMDWLRGRLSS